MAEQEVNGIGLNVDSGLFEVGATLPQTGSWSIGCDVTIEDVDASVQEVRVNDISLSGSLAIPEVSVNIDAKNDKVMDLEIGIAASGLSTGITEHQIVPYDKIVKITEFSPESINERKFASSALAAKRIYDLIKEGGAGLNEDELKAFLKRYGYVTEEYVNELLKNASNFFYLSEDGQSIGTPYNIFSEKEISANGLSVGSGGSGSGEGGGLIRTVLTSSSLGSVTSNDNFTTFNAFAIDSIYKKVKSIEEGNVSLSNYYTKSESDARFALLSSLTTVEEKIREILSWFTIDENGNLRTEFNLYSTKEISAGGFNGTGGSTGGGLISTVLGIDKFGTVTTNSNTSTFNAYAIDSLHKRIKNLEESEVDLTGYATEEWVMGRGFITASALAPYLKTSDFETWKTGSFNPVVSQVNTNKNNIAEILKWFAIDGDGNLYTTYNFYSTKEISSGGFDSGSNGTGGLIGVVYGKSAFGTIANEVNNATFNAYAIDSLYKRIVSLENKEVDLTGYATEAWVAGQGFITSAALSPYMKAADANDTFATKTALNNLSSSHDSLATRVSTAEGNISTNAKGIADNKTAIATNTSNISANATAISNNAKAISGNTTAINTNATAITNLGKRVTANEGNIAEILKWFAVDADGNLYTTYNLYSTKEISANGLSIGSGGSGGGLISQVYGTTAFGTIASESNSATFNAYAIDSLYKRIVSLEGKATAVSFVPALTSGKQIGTLSIDGVSTVLYGVDAYSKTDADARYLKLTGGEVTELLNIVRSNSSIALGVENKYVNYTAIRFKGGNGNAAYLIYSGTGDTWKVSNVDWLRESILLHSNNYSEYALPISGGTINGGLIVSRDAWATQLTLNSNTNQPGIQFKINNALKGSIVVNENAELAWILASGAYKTILHSDNYAAQIGDYYLKTSGGTISGSGSGILTINRTSGTPLISFQANGTNVGFLGIDTISRPCFVDPVYYETNYLIHSGNIRSYAFVPRADNLINNVNADHYWTNGAYLNQTGNGSGNSNFPNFYGIFLSFNNGSSSYVTQFDMGTRAAYYRTKIDNWSKWHQFITDENIGSQSVASATKLATARTIWGQSFDGSGNVTGALKTPSGYNAVTILDSYLVLGQGMAENSLPTYLDGYNVYMRYGKSSTIGLILNSSGNTTIGSTGDLAGTDYKLVVNGLSRFKNNVESEGNIIGAGAVQAKTNAHGFISLQVGSTGNKGLLDSRTSWILYTDGTNTLLPQGKVGIGTTDPQNKLDVAGSLGVGTSGSSDIILKRQGGYSYITATTHLMLSTGGEATGYALGLNSDKSAYFYGAVTMSSTLSVDSSLNVGTVINVGSNIMPKTNETSYLGSTSLRFLAVCAKVADFSGNTTIGGTLGVTGAVTMGSTLSVTGATTMNSTLNVTGDVTAASTIKANSVICATTRLRVNATNSTTVFGFIDAALYGTTNNVSTVHIGSCYGGSSTITNTGEYPNGVSMTAISIYRGVVGIGKRFSDSELRAAYGEGVSLTTSGGLTSTGLITASSGVKVASGQAITFLDASGKEHKLTYDSTAGAFKFDGNILVVGDGQFNAIN